MICNFVIICFDIILQSIIKAVNIFPVPILRHCGDYLHTETRQSILQSKIMILYYRLNVHHVSVIFTRTTADYV